MVQTNFIRDFKPRGVVAVHNGEAPHAYDALCMEDALKRDVERSQLMYKHEMIDSMLSQLANIDQDTNLPVNSYDIDLPIWMTMDNGDPFADVELGSDLSNLRDRFFPDSHRIVPNGNGRLGVNGHSGQEVLQKNGQQVKKSRNSKKNGSTTNGNASSDNGSNVAKAREGGTNGRSPNSPKSAGSKKGQNGKALNGVNNGGVSKSMKKTSSGGKGSKSGGGSNGLNGKGTSSNGDGANGEEANGNGLHRRKKHHNPWTAEETQALIEGVGICGGGKWADIKKLGLKAIERRSAVDLKDKWRNLLRVALLPQQTLRQIERKREVSSEMLAKVRALSTKYKVPNKQARASK